MDPTTLAALLNSLPGQWALALTAAHYVACAITASVPAPKTGPMVAVWGVLNFLAINFGQAKNAPPSAPTGGVAP